LNQTFEKGDYELSSQSSINKKRRNIKMKKVLITLTVVSILAFGAMAFAHGYGGRDGGHMMGQGYGGHMTGSGYGGHMSGRTVPGYGSEQADQKFLDQTADQRKDLHEKRFEYFEAQRDPKTTNKKLANLEKEIYEVQEKINKDAPRSAYRGAGGSGHCF
jgi:hypothetical protein